MLNMLYDIILPEPSMLFHVTMTLTLSCNWCVTVWLWCHVNPNPKSLKIKIKEKEIPNEKRKNKIVRVHCLELWQDKWVSEWVWIWERITEYESAKKHKRKKSQKIQFSYTIFTTSTCKLWSSPIFMPLLSYIPSYHQISCFYQCLWLPSVIILALY